MEGKKQSMTVAVLQKLIEMEGLRVSEIWRSLCKDCRTMTVREIYRADDGEKEAKKE